MSGYFRREWWEPMKRELFGYPRGHRYYQENLFIRFYPLAMTAAFLGLIVYAAFMWMRGL